MRVRLATRRPLPQPVRSSALWACALIFVSGCLSGCAKSGAPQSSAETVRCEAWVFEQQEDDAQRWSEVGPNPDAIERTLWANACTALEASEPCGPDAIPHGYDVGWSLVEMEGPEATTYEGVLTVTPEPLTYSAIRGDDTLDDACRLARRAACRAADASRNCTRKDRYVAGKTMRKDLKPDPVDLDVLGSMPE